MKIAANDIGAALRPLGFQKQTGRNDVTFVRPSVVNGLFERVECLYAGNSLETIVLGVALSVVQHTVVQFRGLIARDGWPEVCTDPDNGRVEFRTSGEITRWLARLVEMAPERFERLERDKGPALLSATEAARARAGAIADSIMRS